jgi:hypothetical protein
MTIKNIGNFNDAGLLLPNITNYTINIGDGADDFVQTGIDVSAAANATVTLSAGES